jgi:hypothetical protein
MLMVTKRYRLPSNSFRSSQNGMISTPELPLNKKWAKPVGPPNQRLLDYVLARPDFVGAGPPKGGAWRVFNNLMESLDSSRQRAAGLARDRIRYGPPGGKFKSLSLLESWSRTTSLR